MYKKQLSTLKKHPYYFKKSQSLDSSRWIQFTLWKMRRLRAMKLWETPVLIVLSSLYKMYIGFCLSFYLYSTAPAYQNSLTLEGRMALNLLAFPSFQAWSSEYIKDTFFTNHWHQWSVISLGCYLYLIYFCTVFLMVLIVYECLLPKVTDLRRATIQIHIFLSSWQKKKRGGG